jgi:hypothetical protein
VGGEIGQHQRLRRIFGTVLAARQLLFLRFAAWSVTCKRASVGKVQFSPKTESTAKKSGRKAVKFLLVKHRDANALERALKS